MNIEIKTWEIENEQALVELYFNSSSDLFNQFNPYPDDECHTEEDFIVFKENFYRDLPRDFILTVYTTLNERCSRCFLKTEQLIAGKCHNCIHND